MTKRRGSHFRSMGLGGESIVTVKPPWWTGWHDEQRGVGCFVRAQLQEPREPQGRRKLGDVPGTAFRVRHLPVLGPGAHQPPLGFQLLPGGCRVLLRRCLWRSCCWRAPEIRGSVQLSASSLCMGSAFSVCLQGKGRMGHSFSHPIHRSAKNPQIRPSISVGKWLPS